MSSTPLNGIARPVGQVHGGGGGRRGRRRRRDDPGGERVIDLEGTVHVTHNHTCTVCAASEAGAVLTSYWSVRVQSSSLVVC